MNPRYLLDTHVIIRALAEPRKLPRLQYRTLEDVVRKELQVCISAISLVEIAFLDAGRRLTMGATDLFEQIETSPMFRMMPLTSEIALEAGALVGALKDPTDCVIVATARVHRLTLLTSDQRIVESGLVPVID